MNKKKKYKIDKDAFLGIFSLPVKVLDKLDKKKKKKRKKIKW